MNRSWLKAGSLLAALGLLVTACGTEAASDADGAAAEEASGAGGADGGDGNVGDAVGEIVLGAPTALGTVEGRASVDAAQLAVDEINEAGGVEIGGEIYTVRLVEADTRGAEPDIPVPDALAAIEGMIDSAAPHGFVVSPFRSEVMLAAMDLIADEQIPTIASIATTPEFQARIVEDPARFKYFFRNSVNGQHLGMYLTGVLRFLQEEHGYDSIMLIHQDVLWARGATEGVGGWAQENGWTVIGNAAVPTGQSDFASALASARDAGADVIMPMFDMPQSGALVPQARGMGIDALIVGFNSPMAAENATASFDAEELEGVLNLIFEIGPLAVGSVPASVRFNEAFGEAYGEEARAGLPGHGPGPSYDAVYIMIDAMQRAGSLDGEAVADALAETDYEGVVGRITFGEDGQAPYGMDPSEAALGALFQWQDGQRVPVYPEGIAEAALVVPN
ncbi:ABC transporter substrate-binding protein [Nitriliruptor alkaliphilus]|uniref:ABC transporter substrate-binding protein n=1 Tax=Nitriliruptor alkaliphilus TaxID=427918 RepID=UPI000697CF59|nr:ABC transporter substrate-binding protein [Nitriliruptor alkaliphilus]